MSNLAEVHDITPHIEAREIRVAEIENGFTRIANELLEALVMADLTSRQLKVALSVMRKTYGFNKKEDRIADSQIAEMTGIHRTHVCNARNQLINMNILTKSGNKLSINKVVSEWCIQNGDTVANSATKKVANSATGDVATSATHKRHSLKTERQKRINTPGKPGGNPSKYAFEGNVIRLNHDDYSAWKSLYCYVDLDAELQRYDIEFQNEQPKSWFMALSAKLKYQNDREKQKRQAAAKSPVTISKTGYVFFDR
ncbi:replication protein [Enterobacter sp. BRE11]|nr:replication protein [Enterobacter sp. BRE11]